MKTTSTGPMRLGLLVLALTVGCGPVEETGGPPRQELGGIIQELEDDNGLIANSLLANGLAFNGLAFNGLAFNGLSSSAFSSWFQQSPLLSNLFMKYLVRCAVAGPRPSPGCRWPPRTRGGPRSRAPPPAH